jgi:hypothetical protein
MTDMVVVRKEGLYCVPGQFYIDPWRPVERAVITHAHGDHARFGAIHIDGLEYGARIAHNGVTISLHPAGHVLGSAQVRIEHRSAVRRLLDGAELRALLETVVKDADQAPLSVPPLVEARHGEQLGALRMDSHARGVDADSLDTLKGLLAAAAGA